MLSILLIALCSFAGNPPTIVQKAFKQKFPKAEKVKWVKEKANEWEAEFVLKGIKSSANFSADGTWLETECEIPISQLPQTVIISIKKQFSDWEVVGADKIESSKNGIKYEADIKSGKKKKTIFLTPDGTFSK